MGFVLTISNFCFMASLMAFFITASKLTKFRGRQKQKFEGEFKYGKCEILSMIRVKKGVPVTQYLYIFYPFFAAYC